MQKWLLGLTTAIALLVTSEAQAQCTGCGSDGSAYYSGGHGLFGGRLFAPKSLTPGVRLAPWYLYWPYYQHFQTPAPLDGPFYGPPSLGYGYPAFYPSAEYYPGSPLNVYPTGTPLYGRP